MDFIDRVEAKAKQGYDHFGRGVVIITDDNPVDVLYAPRHTLDSKSRKIFGHTFDEIGLLIDTYDPDTSYVAFTFDKPGSNEFIVGIYAFRGGNQ